MKTLSVYEYARLKGVSPQWIYRQVKDKKLKTVVKRVRRVLIVVEDTEI